MRWVTFSSAFAALAGYAIILLATQTLGAARFEVFNVFWGLFFAILCTLQGIMHETTRAVRAALTGEQAPAGDAPAPGTENADRARRGTEGVQDAQGERGAGARPLRIAGFIGACAGALIAMTGPLWGPIILEGGRVLFGVVLLSLAAALAAAQSALGGLLSGSGRWGAFGRLLTLEAAARIIVAGIAVVSGDPITGFMIATVAGLVATPLYLLLPAGRAVRGLRADVPAGVFLRRCGQAMLAASATSLLVVGFPVIIGSVLAGADPIVLGNLLLAVTLTRAPILTPLTSFQNAIVVYFVDRAALGRRAAWLPLAAVLGVAALGAALAWFLGPPIIALMGRDFSVGGMVLAALTLAAGFTGSLFITGSAVLARERHGVYLAGWWTATIIAIAILALVPGAVMATVLALSAGPAAGALVHLFAGLGGGRRASRG